MKIAFFEIDYHYTDIVSFCNLMLNSNNDITIYTSTSLYKRLESQHFINKYKWIVKENLENVSSFLARNESQINQNDLVYFSTIASGYKAYFRFNFKPKTVLRIHNANTYLSPLKNIHFEFSIFYFRKSMYYILNDIIKQNSLFYIPKLINKFDYITFPERTIQEYTIKKGLISPKKLFTFLPVSFPDFKKLPSYETLHISIIGLIDERKRDYQSVFEAFKILQPKLNTKINLTILGKPLGRYGKKIIQKFKSELESINFEINTFESFIPQHIFESELEKTNLILAPVQEQLVFGIFNEYCGKTKTTGSLSDMIRMGIPVVMPQKIEVDQSLKPYIDFYHNSEEMATVILKFANNLELLQSRTHALRNSLNLNYSESDCFK